jgi:ParB-like chromosome segregation protein Spo0J
LAESFGVSEEQLAQALKGSRSTAQLRKRLRLDDAKRVDELIERVEQMDHARLVSRVRACKTLEEKEVVLSDEARKWGVTKTEFLLMLRDRIKRFKK